MIDVNISRESNDQSTRLGSGDVFQFCFRLSSTNGNIIRNMFCRFDLDSWGLPFIGSTLDPVGMEFLISFNLKTFFLFFFYLSSSSSSSSPSVTINSSVLSISNKKKKRSVTNFDHDLRRQ